MYSALRDERKAAERKIDAAHVTGTQPSLPLARYTGVYSDSLYGTATVTLNGGKLVARFNPLASVTWSTGTTTPSWRTGTRPTAGGSSCPFASPTMERFRGYRWEMTCSSGARSRRVRLQWTSYPHRSHEISRSDLQ